MLRIVIRNVLIFKCFLLVLMTPLNLDPRVQAYMPPGPRPLVMGSGMEDQNQDST